MHHRFFFLYSLLFLLSPLHGEWLPLQRLSLSEHKGIFPQIIVDPEGNQTAVWQGVVNHHSIIQASTKPYRGEWQKVPTQLSLGEEEAGLPQVAMDQEGRITVIWDQFDGKNFIIHALMKSPQGKWPSTPDQISPAGESAFNPRLAVDSSGTVTAVWEKFDGKHFVIQASTKRKGEPWQPLPDSLSSSDENASFPQVVIDRKGHATAIWHQCGNDHMTRVFASGKPEGGSWQASPDLISLPGQEAFDLQAAVNSFGEVTVVWNGLDGAIWVHQKGQGSPTLLSSPGVRGGDPQVATDGLGRTAVAWVKSQGGGSAIQLAIKKEQGNWQHVPFIFSHPERGVSHPQVAMSEQGDVCVVWCERDGMHDRIRAATKRRKGEWKLESEFLSPSEHHALFPRVVFHPNRMPVVTWQQYVREELFIQVAEKICLLPPRHFNGKVLHHHFVSSTEFLHSFKWEKSLSPSVDHYLLFQNDRLIAKIAKNKKLRWVAHNQLKNKQRTYTLVAVNREGWESPPLKIMLPFSKIKRNSKKEKF